MSVMKPGMISRIAGDHDHGAMRELAAGVAAAGHLGADARHDAKTLVPEQKHAGNAGSQHQADRRQHADLAADNDETGDFQQRQRKQEERKEGNAQVLHRSFPCFAGRRTIAAGTEAVR